MKICFLSTVILSLTAGTILSSPVIAQEQSEDPGHPRINQVENRLEHQENNTERAEKNGKLTEGQAERDERRDQRTQSQLNRDEAKHGGHITKAEQRRLNHEMRKEKFEKRRQERRDHKLREHRARPDSAN